MLHGCTHRRRLADRHPGGGAERRAIGRICLVGAGALVTEGKEFPDGSLIMGAPAKVVRPLTPEQIDGLKGKRAALRRRTRGASRRLEKDRLRRLHVSELHKFLFEGLPVRGMLVRLTDGWREVLRAARANAGDASRRRCARCWARWPRPAC